MKITRTVNIMNYLIENRMVYILIVTTGLNTSDMEIRSLKNGSLTGIV